MLAALSTALQSHYPTRWNPDCPTYDCRALVAEVLVDGNRFAVVADRITPKAMMVAQHMPA